MNESSAAWTRQHGGESPPELPVRGRRARARAVARDRRRHPLLRAALLLATALVLLVSGTVAWAQTGLDRTVDLDGHGPRPPSGRGTNYLIVGSDSRDELTREQRRKLHTGKASGRRTDSMILLHTGAHGSTMVSLPRDSWVTLPGHLRTSTGKRVPAAKNKLNAAFSQGGPHQLVRTVEHNTGLRIDHYAEAGFGGFVDVVNAVGGVRMCLERDIRDEKSGADLKKGCQTLDGRQALAFVRQRHQEADGDLGRTRNQQRLLSALVGQTADPGTLLDPSELYPALDAGLDALVTDRGMGLRDLAAMLRALQSVSGGEGRRLNVPVANDQLVTREGRAVLWDWEEAKSLFADLRHDRPVDAPPAPPG